MNYGNFWFKDEMDEKEFVEAYLGVLDCKVKLSKERQRMQRIMQESMINMDDNLRDYIKLNIIDMYSSYDEGEKVLEIESIQANDINHFIDKLYLLDPITKEFLEERMDMFVKDILKDINQAIKEEKGLTIKMDSVTGEKEWRE